jgi:hypothetical protein
VPGRYFPPLLKMKMIENSIMYNFSYGILANPTKLRKKNCFDKITLFYIPTEDPFFLKKKKKNTSRAG